MQALLSACITMKRAYPVNAYMQLDKHKSYWSTLGKIELPADASIDDTVRVWLIEILNPLNLTVEFFEKFQKSAQASAVRAVAANGLVPFLHIHISIQVPQNHRSLGKSWGFFQIERIDTKVGDIDVHAIDFYLYVEGD